MMRFLTFLFMALLSLNGVSQTQKGTDIEGAANNDGTGASVSMPTPNTIAVGSNFYSTFNSEGLVRIFDWDGIDWIQRGSGIVGTDPWAKTGYSVSMPDSITVAIGSRGDINHLPIGYVRIYRWNGSNWIQKGSTIHGQFFNDHTASSICMPDSNTVAVGAPNTNQIGAVRVFKWDGNDWVQKGSQLNGIGTGTHFGKSVSMPDSNTIAVGAPRWSQDRGYVNIYQWDGNDWVQQGSTISGDNDDHLGMSVSMPTIDVVGIGASGDHKSSTNQTGMAKIYEWKATEWDQKGANLYGDFSDDQFGTSISMPDESTLAVGAPENDAAGTKSGKSWVFAWDGFSWHQKGMAIIGQSTEDQDGTSVDMPDAQTLAVGAPFAPQGYNSYARVFSFCSSLTGLNISECYNYTVPSGMATYDTTGVYMDTLQNAQGCDSVLVVYLTIDLNLSVVQSTDTSLLTSMATNADSLQWIDCATNNSIPGETNNVFYPVQNGEYAVIVYSNGCIDTSDCQIVSTVILTENPLEKIISIYPNPTNGRVYIDLGTKHASSAIVVEDIHGKIIKQEAFSHSKIVDFEFTDAAGIYFIHVYFGKERRTFRLMKN